MRRINWVSGCLLAVALGCNEDGTSSEETPRDAGNRETTDASTSDASTEPDDVPDSHEIPDDAGEGETQCALLASTCHPFDRGTGDQGDQCHDIGHAEEADECIEHFDECMAYCGRDGGPHEPEAAMCEQLGELCHDLDTGDAGLASACHDTGHDGDEDACAAIFDDCVELCGEHHDAEDDHHE